MKRRLGVIAAAAVLCAAVGFFMGAFGQSEGPTRRVPAVRSRLDLNRALPAELERLPGMNRKLLERIIQGRPYHKLDDLVVRRIVGRKEFARIKYMIFVGAPAPTERGVAAARTE